MKSFTGKFTSVRGWALLLALLLGAGMMFSACGEEETPAPTTPTPPPAPPPTPPPPPPELEPEPPAVPTGLQVSATGMDFIEWSWTPVEGVSGYDVQYSANEAFTDEDEVIARTAEEISYRKDGLEAGTRAYLRVRSASGADDDRITSDWSTHVTGMTMEAPPPPEPPATPTGLMVSDTTETSITWTWDAAEGATGYVVQASTDEMFDDAILGNAETVLFDGLPFTTATSYTAADLGADTTLYVRVRSGTATPEALAAALATGSLEGVLLSAWTTHATGMTMAATLAAPANVRVKSRGSNYIEWEWDEVEGADGYQAQFSTDSGFSDPGSPFEIRGASSTSQRVAGLNAESDGYFRVRAYSGTVTDRMFGDWSEADMATTEEPPPPVPLDAPTDLEATDTSDDSITLEWDSVRNADSYEVEQREPGDDWDDASCGGGNNVVEDEECVASGLESGTDYDFRVRAVPADDDAAHAVGVWSDIEETRTSGTTPVDPATPTPGGMGDLNVRWESAAQTITWIWDRRPDVRYDIAVLTDFSDDDDPCSAATWPTTGANFGTLMTSYTEQNLTTPGTVRGLCVRPTEDEENVSYAWAINTPAGATVPTNRDDAATDEDAVTKSVRWTNVTIPAGFTYDLKAVADPQRDNDISGAGTDADDVQKACEGGTTLLSDTADVGFTLGEVSHSAVQPHTGYLLCYQVSNSTGMSEWGVPTDNGEIVTLPGRPAIGSPISSRTRVTDTTTAFVWPVATRSSRTIPREATGYEAKTVTWDQTYDRPDPPDADTDIDDPQAAPNADDVCDAGNGTETGDNSEMWTVTATTNITTDNAGIVIAPNAFTRPTAERDQGNLLVRLCVRAVDSGLNGPWVISGTQTVREQE